MSSSHPAVLLSDRRARFATAITFLLCGASFGNWVPRIPDVKAELGLSNSSLGLALFGIAVGSVIAMQLTGLAMSKWGTRSLVRVTTPVLCIAMLVVPALDVNLAGLFVALIVIGMAHGAVDVSMNGQLIAIERRYRRPIVNSMHAIFSVGGASGALTGGLAATHDLPLATHFAIFAVVGVILSVLTSSMLLSTEAELATVHSRDESGTQAKVSLRQILTRTTVLMGIMAMFAFVAEGAIYDWATVYMHDGLGTSAAMAALAFGMFQGTMAVVRLFADRGVARFGPVNTLRFCTSIGAAGLAIGVISEVPVIAVFGFAAAGLGVAVVVPLLFSAAGHLPSVDAARTLSTVTTAGYLGFFVGPPLIGLMADRISLTGALLIPVALIAVVITQAGLVRTAGGPTDQKALEAESAI